MSYIVTKTIGKRQYLYRQRSYRVGKKVKTESTYLGPVGSTAIGLGGINTMAPDDKSEYAERAGMINQPTDQPAQAPAEAASEAAPSEGAGENASEGSTSDGKQE